MNLRFPPTPIENSIPSNFSTLFNGIRQLSRICLVGLLLSLTTLLCAPALGAAHKTDLELLKKAGIASDGEEVLNFLKAQFASRKNGNPAIKKSTEVEVAALRVLAQSRPHGAVKAVFKFLAVVDDPWLEEELLHSLGELALDHGKADPLLLEMAKYPSPQRGNAGFVLASRGGLKYRQMVRDLLTDDNVQVQKLVIRGLLGKGLGSHYEQLRSADLELMGKHHVSDREDSLVKFLNKRASDAEDVQRLETLIDLLGHMRFRQRTLATEELIQIGAPALPLLKKALGHKDLEVAIRSAHALEKIEQGPGAALPAAVIRRIADHPSPTAVKALLAYVPFTENEQLKEEIYRSLSLMSVRQPRLVLPLLVEALKEPEVNRRATAAVVLGKVGTEDECSHLMALLRDTNPQTQFAAVQGLLAAQEPEAVPVLIDLFHNFPEEKIWKVEELLQRLAGDDGPILPDNMGTTIDRQQMARVWKDWWLSRGPTIDLAGLNSDEAYLGRILICEYDSNDGRQRGRVWETDRLGKKIWEITNLAGPMDAQVLPDGRVLVAENTSRRVVELDKNGKFYWEFRLTGNPIACQRLPNGNTFIATYNQLLEVTPGKQIVWSLDRGPSFYIFSAQKLRNGRVVCMSAQGTIVEIDPATGKEIRSVKMDASGWCGVEGLPGGRFLVAQMGLSAVREVDGDNRTHWRINYPSAFRATRMPNGNTLITSMSARKVAEFDRSGNLIREIDCQGRPWQVRYR